MDRFNFNKAANDFVASLNPNVEGTDQNKRKVVREFLKDVAHFLRFPQEILNIKIKKIL